NPSGKFCAFMGNLRLKKLSSHSSPTSSPHRFDAERTEMIDLLRERGIMTEALQVREGDKILEIGTGSGYQAAVLAEMGARVFTIERHMHLLTEARKRFERF